jgi:hypothetical protein
MWEYLKSKVYATGLHATQEIEDHIMDGSETINDDLLQQVMQNFRH